MRWSQIEGGTFVKYAWELRVKLSRKVYDTGGGKATSCTLQNVPNLKRIQEN